MPAESSEDIYKFVFDLPLFKKFPDEILVKIAEMSSSFFLSKYKYARRYKDEVSDYQINRTEAITWETILKQSIISIPYHYNEKNHENGSAYYLKQRLNGADLFIDVQGYDNLKYFLTDLRMHVCGIEIIGDIFYEAQKYAKFIDILNLLEPRFDDLDTLMLTDVYHTNIAKYLASKRFPKVKGLRFSGFVNFRILKIHEKFVNVKEVIFTGISQYLGTARIDQWTLEHIELEIGALAVDVHGTHYEGGGLFKESQFPGIFQNNSATLKFFKTNALRKRLTVHLAAKLEHLKTFEMGEISPAILHDPEDSENPGDFPELEHFELKLSLETITTQLNECLTNYNHMSFNPPKTLKTLKLTFDEEDYINCLVLFVQLFKNLPKIIMLGKAFDSNPSKLCEFAESLPYVHEIAVKMQEKKNMFEALAELAKKFCASHEIPTITFMDVPKKMRVELMKEVREFNDEFKKQKLKIKCNPLMEIDEIDDDISFTIELPKERKPKLVHNN